MGSGAGFGITSPIIERIILMTKFGLFWRVVASATVLFVAQEVWRLSTFLLGQPDDLGVFLGTLLAIANAFGVVMVGLRIWIGGVW